MRRIKIPRYEFALKMQGGLMREGGRICGTLWYYDGWWHTGPASRSCQCASNRNLEFVNNLCCYDNSKWYHLTAILEQFRKSVEAHTSIICPFWSYHCHSNRNILLFY